MEMADMEDFDDESSVGTNDSMDDWPPKAPVPLTGKLVGENQLFVGAMELNDRPPFSKNIPTSGQRKSLSSFSMSEPHEIVLCFFEQIMHHVVKCFNLASDQEGKAIKKLTYGELMAWHGIRIYMGLWSNPKDYLYFGVRECCGIPTPNLSKVMSLTRFREKIRRNFRCTLLYILLVRYCIIIFIWWERCAKIVVYHQH